MKLHEYQSKAVLKAAGLPVPNSIMVKTADEVEAALKEIDMSVGLVKAQAHTGGRGKAGGVKFFKSVEEAKTLAEEIIGMTLVTKQNNKIIITIFAIYFHNMPQNWVTTYFYHWFGSDTCFFTKTCSKTTC